MVDSVTYHHTSRIFHQRSHPFCSFLSAVCTFILSIKVFLVPSSCKTAGRPLNPRTRYYYCLFRTYSKQSRILSTKYKIINTFLKKSTVRWRCKTSRCEGTQEQYYNFEIMKKKKKNRVHNRYSCTIFYFLLTRSTFYCAVTVHVDPDRTLRYV